VHRGSEIQDSRCRENHCRRNHETPKRDKQAVIVLSGGQVLEGQYVGSQSAVKETGGIGDRESGTREVSDLRHRKF
jgi:hypothetical protein